MCLLVKVSLLDGYSLETLRLSFRTLSTDFTIFRSNGDNNAMTVSRSRHNVVGRSHKKEASPSDRVMARRRLSSNIPPRMKPSNTGAIGNVSNLRMTAQTAMYSISCKSNGLKETR